ncbi:helix-turn-helix domain-containing protein [Streptosporangium saharense]|uniref:Transcriptional regulator with XRE-family HTH domain n=1 Tax=Streptosporangium saharense TaxID=1706840 RepID=A0A7W7QLV2_9ACTN|nr:helix-turn-helix transcriptional regulator [Streptosporangium saharense]MBB4915980.1 transcriptional regulator with XRE-family HTH domain [Streptosporangium saharense]
MAARRGPTLRAQWLGKHLKEYRDAAGLTLRQAGDYLQRDAATISRLESGIIPARVSDVMALLNLYEIDDEQIRDGLEQLSRDIWRKGWWDGFSADSLGGMLDHAWLETRAKVIYSYDAMVIPGLLQTRDYASAVITAGAVGANARQVEQWIEFRVSRQSVLGAETPPKLMVVLDEAVLHRAVGGPEVMRGQLKHLSEVASRPNVTIHILPFSVGAHASPEGAFTVFRMPEPYSDVTYVETRGGAVYTEADGAENFVQTYDVLLNTVLTPDDSATVIRNAVDRFK